MKFVHVFKLIHAHTNTHTQTHMHINTRTQTFRTSMEKRFTLWALNDMMGANSGRTNLVNRLFEIVTGLDVLGSAPE